MLREGDRLEHERGGYDVEEPRKGWQGRPKFEESWGSLAARGPERKKIQELIAGSGAEPAKKR